MTDAGSLDRDQRWAVLLRLVGERGRLLVSEVSAELGVSQATVRRDFAELADQQLVARTHGGVVAASVAYSLPARYRAGGGEEVLDRLAIAAVSAVPSGAIVGLNGGTTMTAVSRQLAVRTDLVETPRFPAVTVVTNALNIASELVLRPHVRCVVLGGVARSESYELSGPLAHSMMDQLWLDVAFLGVQAIAAQGGASCDPESEAAICRLMTERSSRVVVVAEGRKVGTRAFARICEASAIHELVTDETAPCGEVEALRALGLTVTIA